jgi:hypothetical protein
MSEHHCDQMTLINTSLNAFKATENDKILSSDPQILNMPSVLLSRVHESTSTI